MGRTNIVLDDDLVQRAMTLYGFRTKRETIHYALRRLVGEVSGDPWKGLLELEGIGWEVDLEEARASRVQEG